MIDIKKKYRTRDGREVRIYATDAGDCYTVHGAVRSEDRWAMQTWDKNGYFVTGTGGQAGSDLIEVKPRIQRTCWANIYPPYMQHSVLWDTHREAIENRLNNCLATVVITIDVEEGHGL